MTDPNSGWVKLWRKSVNSLVFQDAKLWKIWTWCLMKATHKEHDQLVGYQKIHIMPGEFIFGRKSASFELNISEQTIRTSLDSLRKLKNLTIKSTNKYSVISIINWDTYQIDDTTTNQQTNQQLTSKQPATNQQLTTNKNVKNDKNVKNKDKYFDCVFLTALEYQKLIEKEGEPATMKAIEILNNYKMSSGRKYKSDYHTMLNWVLERVNNGTTTTKPKPKANDLATICLFCPEGRKTEPNMPCPECMEKYITKGYVWKNKKRSFEKTSTPAEKEE